MKFMLDFPDSCYFEDQKHYDMFAEALQKMLNRMAMSHNKYQKGQRMNETVEYIDEIKSSMKRIAMYDETWVPLAIRDELAEVHKPMSTGNTENLLDAANMLVIESIFPKHRKANFKPQSSSDSPGLEYIP